jgi:hypothetical protein
LFYPTIAHSPDIGEEGGTQSSRSMEIGIFAASIAMPGAAAGGGKGIIKAVGGGVYKDFTKIDRFGPQLGAKMNQVANNLSGEVYKFSDHSIERIVQKIGVGNEVKVLDALKTQPFEYFHDGLEKLGYIDSVTRTFVGQIKDSKVITTVINNVGKNYKNNLIKKPK